jgi:hypothetical protein
MSESEVILKTSVESKKKTKNKREATSPLLDGSYTVSTVSTKSSVNSEVIKDQTKNKKCKQNDESLDRINETQRPVSSFPYDWRVMNPMSMAYSQPPYSLPLPPYMPSPPRIPTFDSHASPPSWATELLDDMKFVKQKLQSVEKIEKTVNSINMKITDLEIKFKSLEVRLSDNERFCEFAAKESEDTKRDLNHVKHEIETFQKDIRSLEKKSQSLTEQKEQMEETIINLEMQSLQKNLLFYSIPEEGKTENCQDLVKKLCKETLNMDDADSLVFEKIHRLGKKSGDKARPILATFRYQEQRERVRSASFEATDELKEAGRGVGAQLPRAVREARKPLYHKMEEAKRAGKQIKFIGKKLFIDNVEYKPGSAEMEH